MATLTIELTADQEERVRAEAERHGMEVPRYVQALIGLTLTREPERLQAFLRPPEAEPEGAKDAKTPTSVGENPPIWERFILAANEIPEEERARMPADGSEEL